MSEQPPPRRFAFNSEQVRVKLNSLNFAREQRMFGPAEIIALGGSLLVLLLVVVSYIYFLVPANSRLYALQAERSLLQARLRDSQDFVREGETTEAAVQKISQSLDDFENQQLWGANRGRMALYDTLNSLIRKNGLRNTSGPTYTPLDAAGTKQTATGGHSVSAKWQSIYPGIAIGVTLEGQYLNLRRFVRDLETSKQFIIINSVELERSTDTNNAAAVEGGAPNAPRGTLVSLRLEMATYFQRGAEEVDNTSPVNR